jgi:hypothetical protein
MYDTKGALLYVGCSASPFRRAHQHCLHTEWADSTGSIIVEWFTSSAEALAQERLAIESEKPQFNCRFSEPDKRKRRKKPQARGSGADNSDLLAEIEAYLAATGETRTAFGYRAVNDYGLIPRLEAGTDLRASTRTKIKAAMSDHSEAA